jgi:hypothetical protein
VRFLEEATVELTGVAPLRIFESASRKPFGAVFLFSRQRGCPAEIIMGTQHFHNDDSAESANDLQ